MWLRSPAQPAVICGTVDQLGSRLLFRGYGVGEFRRPIDAALVGADRLLILDEAHLSLPFISTIASASDEEDLAASPVLPQRRHRPVLLSATLRAEPAPADVLRLDPAAEKSPAAIQRLSARRLVRLVDLKARSEAELADAMALVAHAAIEPDGVSRVLVTANTVALARAVFQRLAAGRPDDDPFDLALITGRCRPVERDRIAEEWLLPGGRLSADTPRPGTNGGASRRKAIAVATQTVEVGADLDVDRLVSECCPLDSLLQRLGRVDRRGTLGISDSVLIHQPTRHESRDVITAYGAATAQSWDWLVREAGTPRPTSLARLAAALATAPAVDLGLAGPVRFLTQTERSRLSALPPLAPVILGPQFASWARTSPAPAPDQDVAPFLHGIDRGGAYVDVCWRALDRAADNSDTREEDWSAELQSVPIGAHERVSVPLGEVKRFLAGSDVPGGTDVEGVDRAGDDGLGPGEQPGTHAWLLGADGAITSYAPRLLRPGATVVLPAGAGGYDGWGWTGRHREGPVPDVADVGQQGAPRLRLRTEVMASLIPGLNGVSLPAAGDDEADIDRLLARLTEMLGEDGTVDVWGMARLLSLLRRELRSGRVRVVPVRRWLVVRGTRRVPLDVISEGDPVDAATSTSSRRVGLEGHLRDVQRRACAVATALGLADDLVRAVELAGLAHDLGKADPRFQAMLQGGSSLRAEAADQPLAKSGMDPADRQAFWTAARRSKWPRGMRHEAVSAAVLEALVREHPQVAADVDLDLVRHLVATHHGRSRPLLAAVADSSAVVVTVALPGLDAPVSVHSDDLLIDWQSPSRFRKLGGSYGWWGLALLETIVRLADQTVSAEYGLTDDDERIGAESTNLALEASG